jgi:hypothetical protein
MENSQDHKRKRMVALLKRANQILKQVSKEASKQTHKEKIKK